MSFEQVFGRHVSMMGAARRLSKRADRVRAGTVQIVSLASRQTMEQVACAVCIGRDVPGHARGAGTDLIN